MATPFGVLTVDVDIHWALLIGAERRLVLLGESTLSNILP